MTFSRVSVAAYTTEPDHFYVNITETWSCMFPPRFHLRILAISSCAKSFLKISDVAPFKSFDIHFIPDILEQITQSTENQSHWKEFKTTIKLTFATCKCTSTRISTFDLLCDHNAFLDPRLSIFRVPVAGGHLSRIPEELLLAFLFIPCVISLWNLTCTHVANQNTDSKPELSLPHASVRLVVNNVYFWEISSDGDLKKT